MSQSDTQKTPLLELRGVSKSFVGVEVLSGVDLTCHAGEVHAVVGENGAGKSTLMKVAAGAHRPDGGEVLIDGEPVSFGHARDAQRHGVGIVYQELNVLPDRTVAQNVLLGREPHRGPLVDRGKLRRRARAALAELDPHEEIRLDALVGELSVAQQQTVEIAKALSLDARLLVMDEPTAALSATEAEALFEQVRRLRERGLGVLYISHRLREVFALADRITVLKDGRLVGTVTPDAVTPPELVRMMVGRELDGYFPPHATAEEVGPVRLSVRGGATDVLEGIDLDLRAGEVLGVAGLQGSGRTELARALFGADPFTAGAVAIDGRPVRIRSPRQAIRRRIGFVTEDRKTEGLVLERSVRENGWLTLRSLPGRARPAKARRPGELIEELTRAVELRARSLEQEVRELSGGNQQKVVLTKWLAIEPEILIFDEPTRGIDVGAKAGIHDLIRSLARSGVAVLMISSELPEVIGMSDRVLVLRGGRVAGTLTAEPTEGDIMLMATGEAEPAAAA